METTSNDEVLPRLRPLELIPYEDGGQPYLVLSDRQGIAPEPLVIHAGVARFLELFDGEHTRIDLQAAFTKASGEVITRDLVDRFVGQLDDGLVLESPSFEERRREIVDAFRDARVRPPSHGGGAYPEDPSTLRSLLDERRATYMSELGSDSRPPASDIVGWMAPHIDYERGAACYARTYGVIETMDLPDVFLLLGTAHAGLETPLSVCGQAFETPLATFECDVALATALEERFGAPTDHDVLVHRNEHSLELTATYLAYALGGRTRPIVPVLVGMGASDFARSGREPQTIVASFAELVVEHVRARGIRACIVAGVDFAHVGPRFGDQAPVDQTLLDAVERSDRDALLKAAELDADGFIESILSVEDRYRVCGAGALYTALTTLQVSGASAGRLIDYGQATAPDASQCVSFAGMVFQSPSLPASSSPSAY